MRTARSKQASFLASYFCNTTRRDRLKTTRFLENNGHAQRDRRRTTDGRFLLIPRCRDRDPGGPQRNSPNPKLRVASSGNRNAVIAAAPPPCPAIAVCADCGNM